jgi:Protein of unknown function DUF58
MDVFQTHGVAADTETLLRLRHVARAGRSRTTRLTGMPGGFVSRRRGRGLEPDEIRAYVEGDDVRHIDRNVTARTGVPHVRTFRDERDRVVLLVADFRPSMLWGTRRALRSVAAAEALSLAGWLAVDSGARVGLIAFGAGEPVFVPPRGRERGMVSVIGNIAAAHQAAFANASEQSLARGLELAARVLPSGGTVILATGLDHPGDDFEIMAERLMMRGRLSICLVIDAFEKKPPPGTYPFVTAHSEIAFATVGRSRHETPRPWRSPVTDPLAGLVDGKLPAANWPEVLAALAIGLFLAAVAGFCLRFIAWRPPSARDRLTAELLELRNLSDPERLAGQAAIAKRLKPAAIDGLEQAIYQRNPALSPHDVETQLFALIKKARI